jgi:plastocyanin
MRPPALLIALVALSACGGGRSGGPAEVVIDLQADAGSLRTSVAFGTSVRWRSADGQSHLITSASAPEAFGEVQVPAGGVSEPLMVRTPGAYPYFCSIDARGGQSGTLVIEPVEEGIHGDD